MLNQLFRKKLNLSRIPQDLASVTRIDSQSEIDPSKVGMSQKGVDAIWHSVEKLYQSGTQPAITLCLRRKGEIVLHRSIGHASGNGPHESGGSSAVIAEPETPVCLFSGSKAVTALLMHMLDEDGLINLMDPVSYYAPEFAKNGKANITIHHVLSHRGGIPGLPTNTPPETLWDTDEIWRLLCEAEPITVDGKRLAYHALTGGYVLERVLNKVTGGSIQTYLDERIRKPMGMKYFTYGLTDDKLPALARNYITGPNPMFPLSWIIKRALGGSVDMIEKVINDRQFTQAVIPAGNLVSTAEEASRFFQMMMNGGTWEGKQVCSPMTIRRATQEYGQLQFDRTLMIPMRYSAGLMLGGDPVGIWGRNSGMAYGHLGLINKLCWADEARGISVSLLTSGIAFLAHHIPALIGFVNQVTRNCEIR